MRVVVLAAIAVTVAAGCGAAGGTRPQPSVRITAVVPQAQVRGAHFFPRERVTVTLTAGNAVRVRRVRAGAGGGFLAGFGALDPDDRCGTTPKVVAVGSKGSRASATRPKAECPPPLDD
jgi:hypothetical protein